jgi:hypothetical protein
MLCGAMRVEIEYEEYDVKSEQSPQETGGGRDSNTQHRWELPLGDGCGYLRKVITGRLPRPLLLDEITAER